jgi:hypothetical protein
MFIQESNDMKAGFIQFKHYWLIASLLAILVLALFDFFLNLDNLIYQQLFPGKLGHYDLPFWDILGAIGSILAALAAFRSVKKINQQLAIQQEPYLVLNGPIQLNEKEIIIKIENIGRGLATCIQISFNGDNFSPLFKSDEPHSINLKAGKSKNDWRVDPANVKEALSNQLLESISQPRKKKFSQILKQCSNDFEFKLFIKGYLDFPNGKRLFLVKLKPVCSQHAQAGSIGMTEKARKENPINYLCAWKLVVMSVKRLK